MKIEKSKLKLKKILIFFLFKQIYKKYTLKPNFISHIYKYYQKSKKCKYFQKLIKENVL